MEAASLVTEREIAAVTKFWRAQGEAEYVENFLEGPKDAEAVRLNFEFSKASTISSYNPACASATAAPPTSSTSCTATAS